MAIHHRERPEEQLRIASLLRLLPPGKKVLEIGARDGYITHLLADRFEQVVALDLDKPQIERPRIACVAGDVRSLPWESNHFDAVVCSEVLEHIPPNDLPTACQDLIRVASRYLLIGVPFEQDLRVARTRCAHCGAVNPPYGHVNRFDEPGLRRMFAPLRVANSERVGVTSERTNRASASLMRLAKFPWGSYDQDEPCIECGGAIGPPPKRTFRSRVLAGLAVRLDKSLSARRMPRAKWIHLLFEKPRSPRLDDAGRSNEGRLRHEDLARSC